MRHGLLSVWPLSELWTYAIAEAAKDTVDARLNTVPVLDTLGEVGSGGALAEGRADIGARTLGRVLVMLVITRADI